MKTEYFNKMITLDLSKKTDVSRISSLKKGTYILILYLKGRKRIQIGRLGTFDFPRGYYAYVGSAFGPGGSEARLKHHLKIARKRHWHIDYLRREAMPKEVWIYENGNRIEHELAGVLQHPEDTVQLVSGFGSSDCMCKKHLFYFKNRPQLQQFQS